MAFWRDRAVWVGALGYFVDTYDLVLFSVVRKASLTGMGVPEADQQGIGLALLDWQMVGMLLGGLFWGILGDRLGRRSVLFGSIIIYSLANLANAGLSSLDHYYWLRLVAGFGLAGELGAAVTLVAERLEPEERGYGTMLVAGVGLAGAVVAALVGARVDWRSAYLLGGLLGLILLILRVGTPESGLFRNQMQASRFELFLQPGRLWRFLACILLAIPIWWVGGVLTVLAPEFGKALQVPQGLQAPTAVFYLYTGATVGDFLVGALSQRLRSRKKAILISLVGLGLCSGAFLNFQGASASLFYGLYFWLGLCTGFWSVFVTFTAEQFGTDLRATATTSAPNFVRAAVVPINLSLKGLEKLGWGVVSAAGGVGVICFVLSLLGLWSLPETFGRNLDFREARSSGGV
ncbi:MFS transporter [bacterium]|nr:MFS transporter [bacterium]